MGVQMQNKYVLWLVHMDQIVPDNVRYTNRTNAACKTIKEAGSVTVSLGTPWHLYSPELMKNTRRFYDNVGTFDYTAYSGTPLSSVDAIADVMKRMASEHPDIAGYHHLIGGGMVDLCEREFANMLTGGACRLPFHSDTSRVHIVQELSYPLLYSGEDTMTLEKGSIEIVSMRELFPDLISPDFHLGQHPLDIHLSLERTMTPDTFAGMGSHYINSSMLQ